MTGYAVVVAMLACALVAVLIAGAMDGREPGHRRLVVVLGASDATGQGTPNPARDSWVARLAADLPDDIEIRNFGVGGSTLAQALREQLPRALAARPNVAVCWLAVNDIASGVPLSAYEQDLTSVVRRLRSTGSAVIVGNLPDLSRVPALAWSDGGESLRRTADAWNAAVARLAAAEGATVVDLFAEPMTVEDFGPDGFHPSPLGHGRLAARFRPAVERALADADRGR
ncbi:MAG: GDSL-type esterase/lipase family protein [Chloroflexota bacterium]|nr:GDSL-type esterase/lipase family protein [Chloroflexota bacterium]